MQKYRAAETSLTGHSSSAAPLRRHSIIIALDPGLMEHKAGIQGYLPGAGLGGPKKELHWAPTNAAIRFKPPGAGLTPRSKTHDLCGQSG